MKLIPFASWKLGLCVGFISASYRDYIYIGSHRGSTGIIAGLHGVTYGKCKNAFAGVSGWYSYIATDFPNLRCFVPA